MRIVTIAASIAFLAVGIWGIAGLLGQFGMQGDGDNESFMTEDLAGDEDDWGDEVAMEVADDENGAEEEAEGEIFRVALGRPIDFVHQLTEEELYAVLPNLDVDLMVSLIAEALFYDGNLVVVEVLAETVTGEWIDIQIAVDEIELIRELMYLPDESQVRYIHGIAVTIYEFYEYGAASFMLDDITYYVEFSDEDIISQIILGGPADLSVLIEMFTP